MKGIIPKLAAIAALLVPLLINSGTVSAQANFQPRIVGGSNVDISAFPSTVAILLNSRLSLDDPFYQAQNCGGTLIGPTWVLTAAHCMFINDRVFLPSELSVLAGTTNLIEPVTNTTAVSRIIVHEGYRSVVFGDDIALLKLAEPAPAPGIEMNTQPLPANQDTFVVGWGSRINIPEGGSGSFPSILQGATVPIRVGAECAALPGSYQFVNPDTQICAGFPQGGIDSCQGDSGGPLYNVVADGSLRVAGITSWGDGCALANRPGIYTDVAAYRDWIFEMTASSDTTPDVQPDTQPDVQPDTQPDTQPDQLSIRSPGGGGSASLIFVSILLLLIYARTKVVLAQKRAQRIAHLI